MPDSKPRLRWGVLGTGSIARTFARELPQSRTGRLVAAGSRTQEAADKFAEAFGPLRAHGSYEALLEDPAVDAVYISTPHPLHKEWCLRAAENGKHILCEKPLTMSHREAEAVARAARRAGVFLMEAFMYRCHPQTAKLVELIRGGVIGKIGVVQATFSFQAPFDARSRFFDKGLGGGGILDVGCYAVSIARLVAGAATGRPFANPMQIQGHGVLQAETGADLYAIANAEFPGGVLALLATGVGIEQKNGLRIYGAEGSIHVPDPFVVKSGGGMIHVTRPGQAEAEKIAVPADRPMYALEADAVGEAIQAGALEAAAMPVDDSLGNMAALDAWRSSIHLVYDCDLPVP
jgi:predicted dehydrogenase